jgi:glutathione synthase/RimK-type ligase-like ATP-grasp enzyme
MILVISAPNSYASKRLLQEAKKLRIKLDILSAEELLKNEFKVDINKYRSLYIRNPYVKGSPKYLGEIVNLAKKFNSAQKKVVDSNIANGNLGQGKWVDYQKLMKAGLPIPATKKLESGSEKLGYPFILKWIYGLKGTNVFLVNDYNQLKKILPLHPKKEWLVQEFIKADYEYKVATVGYKALPVVLRFKMKQHNFKLEYDRYKVIKSSQVPKITEIAEKASKLLGRELSKIDILQKGKNFYILEVNRFPGLESFEELTKYNATKGFLEYLRA